MQSVLTNLYVKPWLERGWENEQKRFIRNKQSYLLRTLDICNQVCTLVSLGSRFNATKRKGA